jgi:hypothetical protein
MHRVGLTRPAPHRKVGSLPSSPASYIKKKTWNETRTTARSKRPPSLSLSRPSPSPSSSANRIHRRQGEPPQSPQILGPPSRGPSLFRRSRQPRDRLCLACGSRVRSFDSLDPRGGSALVAVDLVASARGREGRGMDRNLNFLCVLQARGKGWGSRSRSCSAGCSPRRRCGSSWWASTPPERPPSSTSSSSARSSPPSPPSVSTCPPILHASSLLRLFILPKLNLGKGIQMMIGIVRFAILSDKSGHVTNRISIQVFIIIY